MTNQFSTSVTRLFGTRLPIVAGGLQWLADGNYVAAAARSGIIGFMTAASHADVSSLRNEIAKCRDPIGTRFLVAEEIWAHRAYKDTLVAATETDTALIMQSVRNTVRALKNKTTEAVSEIEKLHGGNFELLRPHMAGALGRKVYEHGDSSTGALSLGQAVTFADRVEPLAEIVRRLEAEMVEAVDRLARFSGRIPEEARDLVAST